MLIETVPTYISIRKSQVMHESQYDKDRCGKRKCIGNQEDVKCLIFRSIYCTPRLISGHSVLPNAPGGLTPA